METSTILAISWIICLKFHFLFPLATMSDSEVSRMFRERVLAYVGAPQIFLSDNGREFVNQLMCGPLELWNSDISPQIKKSSGNS